MEDSTESILQGILAISSDTLKDALFCLGVNISDLTNLKKRKFVVEIKKGWGKHIIEEGEMNFLKAEDIVRDGVIN